MSLVRICDFLRHLQRRRFLLERCHGEKPSLRASPLFGFFPLFLSLDLRVLEVLGCALCLSGSLNFVLYFFMTPMFPFPRNPPIFQAKGPTPVFSLGLVPAASAPSAACPLSALNVPGIALPRSSGPFFRVRLPRVFPARSLSLWLAKAHRGWLSQWAP